MIWKLEKDDEFIKILLVDVLLSVTIVYKNEF